MKDTKVTTTPAKAEAGSSEPARQLSNKNKSYNQRRNAKKKQAKNNGAGYTKKNENTTGTVDWHE